MLWSMLLKSHQGCRVSSRQLRRSMHSTQQFDAWRLSREEVEEKKKEDKRLFRTLTNGKGALSQRENHLSDSKQRLQRNKSGPDAKARLQRLRWMRQREDARRIRRARGKSQGGGLKAIKVDEGPEIGMTTCLTQDDVEKGCIEENIARFDQTRFPHPTPPMSEPLFSTFTGPLTQSTIEALLDGRLDVDSLSSGPTRSFLLQCRWPCLPSQTPPRVTPADNTEFWSKAKENKSSEPNGLHNGHFKAGATSLLLSQCDAIFRDIPMNKGFVPDQWKNLMNFAIEKKPGEIRVSKMRTIQLMNP